MLGGAAYNLGDEQVLHENVLKTAFPARRTALSRLAAFGLAGPAALAALLHAPPARAQFRIDVTGVGATQVPVAVAGFREEAAAGQPVAQIIRNDLERSGVFRTFAADAVLDERSAVSLADWKAKGADALVGGSVSRLADGRLDVRFKLWDAVRNEELLGQSKLVLPADLRLAAHRIADDIQLMLTGEQGVNATRIAYVLKVGRRFTLHITDADGEGVQVALASNEPIISPAWSPDGKQLAYVSFETQKAVVWVQDVATGARRMLANFRGSNSAPAWSPDSKQLAVTLSSEGIAQLFTLPAAGGTPVRLTRSSAIDTEAVFAPDGKSLFFVSDRGGGPQIYRLPMAGGAATGGAQRVSFSGNYNISPAISPNGKLLAYITRQGNAYRLVTQELDSGIVTPLTDTTDDESPSFAPNGRQIVYASRVRGADVLVTTTLDGKIKTRLVSSGADVREPAWGPFRT